MALKNSQSKSRNTFDIIQKCLATHGAQRMIFDYNQQGQIEALQFGIEIDGRLIGFKLPAKIENTCMLLYGCLLSELGQSKTAEERRTQAYRTTWANIRDWITAQMAMIDTNQVKFEEVFFPYMLVDKKGTTLFERESGNNFLMLSGKKDEDNQ